MNEHQRTLWHLFVATPGSRNRRRIVDTIASADRPLNANQLARELDLDYKTVRHHLDRLGDADVVASTGGEYDVQYSLTAAFEARLDAFEALPDPE